MLQDITQKGKLSIGIFTPIESYKGDTPTMTDHLRLAQKAEKLGFKALWFRDVPLHDPYFGDVGQMYDPWIYMTYIAAHTSKIQLAAGSIILPFRHPINTLKSAVSLQDLSNNRLILGVASGDRAIEYPAFGLDRDLKGDYFRDSFEYIKALYGSFPSHESKYYGEIRRNGDLLPKVNHKIPMLVTGHSGQSLDWIAKNGDGWIYYPRDIQTLKKIQIEWKNALNKHQQEWKPFVQSLYIDLSPNENAAPFPIHLGYRTGVNYLNDFLHTLEKEGVNHVILNLKYGQRPAEEVIEEIGEKVLPNFNF